MHQHAVVVERSRHLICCICRPKNPGAGSAFECQYAGPEGRTFHFHQNAESRPTAIASTDETEWLLERFIRISLRLILSLSLSHSLFLSRSLGPCTTCTRMCAECTRTHVEYHRQGHSLPSRSIAVADFSSFFRCRRFITNYKLLVFSLFMMVTGCDFFRSHFIILSSIKVYYTHKYIYVCFFRLVFPFDLYPNNRLNKMYTHCSSQGSSIPWIEDGAMKKSAFSHWMGW